MYILSKKNKKEINFYYSFNENTTFIDLIEYISSLYPEYNFCPCCSIEQEKSFKNDDKIVNKINNNYNKKDYYKNYYNNYSNYHNYHNDDDRDILYLNIYCNKCFCNEIVRNNHKLSKYIILDEYRKLLNNDYEKTKKIQSLENDNQNNLNTINSLQIDKKIKENKIYEIQKERDEKLKKKDLLLNQKKEEIDKLKKDKEIIELAVNNPEILNNLGKLGVEGPKIKPKDNIIQIDQKTNQIKGDILKYEKVDPNNFYDIIVDIKSIKDINKGWEIKMIKEGEENYNKYKNEEILKIGVIGNMNKGKSFLLSKLSKINLPSGTSIRTEGLSVKYPEIENGFQNRRIALLDSAGLETPVLKDVDFEQTENGKKENGQSDDVKKKEREYFREKSKEKIITELFLQRYIINNSDILIIVVGILSYSE